MRIVTNIKIKQPTILLTTIKYVPSKFNSSVSTYIFEGKVALIMRVDFPMRILIKHKTVYESCQRYFEYLWKTAIKLICKVKIFLQILLLDKRK